VELTAQEALASLRVLVAIAQADGVLHERERVVLEAALADVELPDGSNPQDLLHETPDLEAAIAQLQSQDARRHAYSAAFAMARADGECHPTEAALLDRLREALAIEPEQHERLERLFSDLGEDARPWSGPVDPAKRADTIAAETRKCAIVSAVLGAFPFPGLSIATDLAVAGLQVGLARDIAKLYGHDFGREAAKNLLSAFGVGTGARIAVTNLLKFFPGWGSAAGAAAAYASSYAVGRTVNRHFEGGDELDVDALRNAFEEARKAGKKAYAADREHVEAHRLANEKRLEQLRGQLEAGEITQAEFETAVASAAA
jgi:uncharacterized protein (DUF697 family)/tellurite resistance protein